MNIHLQLESLDNFQTNPGGKGRSLKKLHELGVRVPETRVISNDLFEQTILNAGLPNVKDFFRGDHFDSYLAQSYLKTIKEIHFSFPDNIKQVIQKYPIIIRSSCLVDEEYASEISGAFESVVVNCEEEWANSIHGVWSSVFAESAFDQMQLIPEDCRPEGMAILVQPYLRAYVSGILHAKGQKGSDEVTIRTTWIKGHLRPLASGDEVGNEIIITSDSTMGPAIQGQENVVTECVGLGLCAMFEELYLTARKLSKTVGSSLEIEWLYDHEHLWILQAQELIDSK